MAKVITLRMLKNYPDQSWAYENFSPVGKPHIVCPNCRSPVMLFEELSASEKREIASLLEELGDEEANEKLQQLTGCDERQAKVNCIHICRSGSRCNCCKAVIPVGAMLCKQCMSVNLHW